MLKVNGKCFDWEALIENPRKAVKVDAWYDVHTKLWCIQKLDEDGYQVGDAEYVYGKANATQVKEEWECLMLTKDEMISKLVGMANKLVKHYSYDLNKRMWTLCSDWNREHPDEEIFMCEECFNGSETVNGFYIEDDYWIIPE